MPQTTVHGVAALRGCSKDRAPWYHDDVKVLSWEAVFGTGFFGTIDLERKVTEAPASDPPVKGADLQHGRMPEGETDAPGLADEIPEARDC